MSIDDRVSAAASQEPGPFLDEIKAVSEQYAPDTQAQPQIKHRRDALVVPLTETWVVRREFEAYERLHDHEQSKKADPIAGRAE